MERENERRKNSKFDNSKPVHFCVLACFLYLVHFIVQIL